MKKQLFLLLFLFPCVAVGGPDRPNGYLEKVLENLGQIKSATYRTTDEAWHPGDTVAAAVYCHFVHEYDNPADSTIGAGFATFDCGDTTRLDHGYNGEIRVVVYHDKKFTGTDDFTARPLPFRLVSPPFFNYTRSIIRYALSTTDNVEVSLTDLGGEYYLKMVVHEDEQIEFFGQAYRIPKNPYCLDPTSVYELWITKSDGLPYKYRREMSHDISVRTRLETKYNTLSITDFDLYSYFNPDYEVRKYGQKRSEAAPSGLIGEKAPDWILDDMNGRPVSLSDFTGKVLLVNFTGIGCGPCAASIPFLKGLKESFRPEDLDVAAIETWTRKPHSLQNYTNRNGINYIMLSATDEVVEAYQTGGSAPVFFVLDEQRIVRAVFRGYGGPQRDREIRNAVTDCLNR